MFKSSIGYTKNTYSLESSKYVSFFQDDTDESLIDSEIATFDRDGYINIQQDMLAIIHIHILGSTSNTAEKRSWFILHEYGSDNYIGNDIEYGTHTTTDMIALVRCTKGMQFGVYTIQAFTVNNGIAGTYAEVIKIKDL